MGGGVREGRGRFLAIRHVPYFLTLSPQQRLRHFRSMLGLVTCKGGYCPLACVPPVQFSCERLEHSDVSFNYIIHKYETFLFSHTHTLLQLTYTTPLLSLLHSLSLLVTHAAPPWSLSHEYIAKCLTLSTSTTALATYLTMSHVLVSLLVTLVVNFRIVLYLFVDETT